MRIDISVAFVLYSLYWAASIRKSPFCVVGQVGLEPTMVKPADLQSAAIAARRLKPMVEPAGIEPATLKFSVWSSALR